VTVAEKLLVVSRENWWQEIHDHDFGRDEWMSAELLGVVGSFLFNTIPPMITGGKFEMLVSQVNAIQIDQEKAFLVRMQGDGFFRAMLTEEKSAHWDDFYITIGAIKPCVPFTEGFPKLKEGEDGTCQIIVCDGRRLLAREQIDDDGLHVWKTRDNEEIDQELVAAWFKM
jgi:hypothetical protein